MNKVLLTILLVWINVCTHLLGQSLTFDHLTIDEGLSNNTIYAILEDRDGFLWFGSRDGLNRYDGYEFEIYKADPQDSTGLQHNTIQCLLEDKAGNIWIGLRKGGFSILERKTQKFRTNPLSKPLNWSEVTVQTIFQDQQGDIWIGTLGHGLIRTNPALDQVDHFHTRATRENSRLRNDLVFSIAEDVDQNIWIATEGPMLHYYSKRQQQIRVIEDNPEEGLNLGSYSKALLAQKETLWVGTEGNHLYLYDLKRKTFQQKRVGNGLVKDITLDSKGRIWVSTDGSGLFYSDNKGESFQNERFSGNLKNSLNTNALYDLFADSRDNVWVGSFNGGVNVYKPYQPEFLTFLQSINKTNAPGFQSVLCFLEDQQNKIWIGTDGGGLLKFDPVSQTFEIYQHTPNVPNTLSSNVITSLYQDQQGDIWVGTFAQGLNQFDPQTKRVKRLYQHEDDKPNSLVNNNVWDIQADHQGHLWIATLGGGLSRLDLDTQIFTHFLPDPKNPKSLSDVQTRVLLLDSKQNLWIGTEYGGLNMLPAGSKKFQQWRFNPRDPRSLPANSVLCLLEDQKGNIWVGTEGGGLACLEAGKSSFKNYSTQDGLPSNVINALEVGHNGMLWISTNMGLSAYNSKQKVFTNYNKRDGLQSNQFNPDASLKSQSGTLFFGGINGFNQFSSKNLKTNPHPPRIAFTDFKLFNQSLPVGAFEGRTILPQPLNASPRIHLSYFDNVFTIEFAALEYTNPSENQLAYRLKGFEDQWSFVDGGKRSATFTNLDADTYVFEVKAANNHGVWNEEIKQLTIEISPPFWETLWFRGLVLITVLGIFFAYVRFQNQRREEKFKQKLLLAEQKILQQDKERLEAEVERKNSELSASLLEFAHKNNALQDLKRELDNLRSQPNSEPEAQKKIRQLVRKIDSEIKTENYWDQFQLHFDKVHQDFSRKILDRHPNLTSNELRLCCFIRINLANADIASIQNISIRGVEKSRYRLKKKLKLSREDDLNQYIFHF